MTPHIKANINDIKKVVLMPGDPLRAKWIAETFLTDYKEVNNVRNMLAYTGMYNGIQVTVMGHGMGNPSIGIYSYELYKFYDVDLIIRIGSCGSYKEDIKVNDVILVNNVYSESNYHKMMKVNVENNDLKMDSNLNQLVIDAAKENNKSIKLGKSHASDCFYNSFTLDELVRTTDADVVEMEAFALRVNAIKNNKDAIVLLTCSDSLVTGESLDPIKRQTTFRDMCLIALETAKKYLLKYK